MQLQERDVARGVLPRFRDVVAAWPDEIAVSDADTRLTYRELASEAAAVRARIERVIGNLAPHPAAPDSFGAKEPVAIMFSHSVDAVVGLLAVLSTGHPILVLDGRSPSPRLRTFMTTVGARLLLCDAPHVASAHNLTRHVLVASPRSEADPAGLFERMPEPTAIAAVAFTSGSTGAPKPVANDHRLLVQDAYNSSIATGCYGAGDVLAHTLPIAFHAGLTTTVHGLVVGAHMHLYDARRDGIAGLPAVIARHHARLMVASPAILRSFCATGPDPKDLASLRSLTVAGETAYGPDIELARPLLPPQCVIRNRYGSSETGLIAEYPIPSDHPRLVGPLPVGRGVGSTRLRVIAEDGTDVPAEETGRLVVVSPNVANGYWGNPEATAKSFQDNEDGTRSYFTSDLGRIDSAGNIQIVGRADHSIKIRGYLVDPGEVDAVLFGLPMVKEAVVVGDKRPSDGRNRLVAYVVGADPEVEPNLDEVRAAVRSAVPGHMVPEIFMALPALPRSDRGKIDRSALPEPVLPDSSDEPLSRFEELVAREWQVVLDTDQPIGAFDDFFALGGDSLAAEALMARLGESLNVDRSATRTTVLAESPRLRDFAAQLNAHQESPKGGMVTLREDGSGEPMFFFAGAAGLGVAFVSLVRKMGLDRPAYAMQSHVLEGRGLPEWSVQATARRAIKNLRRLQPHGPYTLVGYSFGGLVAYEVAQRLRSQGEQVHLAILDSFPPDPAEHPAPEPSSLKVRLKALGRLYVSALQVNPGGSDPWRFFLHTANISRRYRGKTWAEPTLLLLADTPEKEQRAQWSRFLTGPVDLVEIGADHNSVLLAPWVDEVATRLRSFLRPGAASPGTPAPTDAQLTDTTMLPVAQGQPARAQSAQGQPTAVVIDLREPAHERL